MNERKKFYKILPSHLERCHDIQHNDAQHNGLICDIQHNINKCHYTEDHYAECHYVECRYGECRGTVTCLAPTKKLFQAPIVWCRLMRVSGDHRSGPDVIKLFTSVIYKMFEIS
jgi:hypothetical protein